MKINIWYKYTNFPYGGANNFLRRLGRELVSSGHRVEYGYCRNADVTLVNAFVNGTNHYIKLGEVAQMHYLGNLNFLARLPYANVFFEVLTRRRKGSAIVHRIDGVTALYGRNTPGVDQLVVKINRFADSTVFQSKFSQTSFEKIGLQAKHDCVINNGVPADIFYPLVGTGNSGRDHRKIKLIAVSWSSNMMKGFETLAKISLLNNVTLTFVGNWPPSINPGQTQIIPPLSENKIAQLLRHQDAFVHVAFNDPSSNAIIEALACGLPVLYRDSGGNSELVRDCGMPINDNLTNSIEQFMDEYPILRQRVLQQLDRFSIKRVAKQYEKTMCQTLETINR